MADGSDSAVQVPAILRSLEEAARYMRWIIGSAFEGGLARLVQAGESDRLQAAVTLTVQTYLGRNRGLGEHLSFFPAGKAILAVLGSAEPIFRHQVWIGSQHTLQLALQRYAAVNPLVQDVLRMGNGLICPAISLLPCGTIRPLADTAHSGQRALAPQNGDHQELLSPMWLLALVASHEISSYHSCKRRS
jgi:hypothetical protein